MKRILSMAIALCMTLSVWLALPVAADELSENETLINTEEAADMVDDTTLPEDGALEAVDTRQEEIVVSEGRAEGWEMWNDITFDSLENTQYTLGTNETFTNKTDDGGLAAEKTAAGAGTWSSAWVLADMPEDKPISDGTYYMELDFQTNVTGSGKFYISWLGEKGILLNASLTAAKIDFAASAIEGVAGGWLGKNPTAYAQGTRTKLGIIYDTADCSIMFCKDRQITDSTKYYTRGANVDSMNQLKVEVQGDPAVGEYGRVYSFKIWKTNSGLIENLKLSDLTDDIASAITKNLTLPTELADGSTVTWSSSDEALIETDGTVHLPDGEIVWNRNSKKQGQTAKSGGHYRNVKLTANISNRGIQQTKTFNLWLIPAAKANYLYLDRETFDNGTADLNGWTLDDECGTFSVGTGTSIHSWSGIGMATIKHKSKADILYCTRNFVTKKDGNKFGATGKVFLEVPYELGSGVREYSLEVLDSEGGTACVVRVNDWNNKVKDPRYSFGHGFLTVGCSNNAEGMKDFEFIQTGEGFVSDDMVYEQYGMVSREDLTHVLRFYIDTETRRLQIYIDYDAKSDKASAKSILLVDKYIYADAKDIGAVRMSLGPGRAAACTTYFDDISLAVESDNRAKTRLELDKANFLTFDNIKGSNANRQRAVVEDLDLAHVPFYLGTELVSWTSSDETVVSSETGAVTRSSADKQVTLTATLRNGDETMETEIPIVVKRESAQNIGDPSDNIFTAGNVTVSSGSASQGNANDGQLGTAWTALMENSSLQIALAQPTQLSRVVLHEKEADVGYLVKGFVIEVSDNGSSWRTVAEGTTVGDDKVIDFQPVETKYIRYRVTAQDAGYTGLYEIEGYYEPTDENRVKADIEWLKTLHTGTTVSGALDLPTTGKFGSAIQWESSNTAVLSNDGKTFTKPKEDTQFTLTATVQSGSYSQQQAFPKKATGSGGNGGSGNGSSSGNRYPDKNNMGSSGSGGALSSGGGLVNVLPGQGTVPTPTPVLQNDTFRDVPKGSWCYEYVEELAGKGIVGGYNGAFYPTESVTREEFVKMLLGMLEIEPTETAAAFGDVKENEWYTPYVATAAKLGIVDGIGGGTFGIGQTITRQDMAVMVQRALEATGGSLTQTGAVKRFTDDEIISGYAKEAVESLVRAGVISGDENGRFNPQDNLTREQAAKIICISGGIKNEK